MPVHAGEVDTPNVWQKWNITSFSQVIESTSNSSNNKTETVLPSSMGTLPPFLELPVETTSIREETSRVPKDLTERKVSATYSPIYPFWSTAKDDNVIPPVKDDVIVSPLHTYYVEKSLLYIGVSLGVVALLMLAACGMTLGITVVGFSCFQRANAQIQVSQSLHAFRIVIHVNDCLNVVSDFKCTPTVM